MLAHVGVCFCPAYTGEGPQSLIPSQAAQRPCEEARGPAGGTRAGQREASVMEPPPLWLQGTMIHWEMTLKGSTEKINRERQMDGMSSNHKEIIK